MEHVSQVDERIDGRKARSEKTRALIVEAMMDLIEEGDLQPTSERVATRAVVGHRTVFRHFQDMDTLHQEISKRLEARVLVMIPAIAPEDDLASRIGQMVKARSAAYEDIKMFRRSTAIRFWQSSFLQKTRGGWVKFLRDQLLQTVPEFEKQPQAIQDAAELLSSFEAWEQLRFDQKRSIAKARATMEQGLLRLLN